MDVHILTDAHAFICSADFEHTQTFSFFNLSPQSDYGIPAACYLLLPFHFLAGEWMIHGTAQYSSVRPFARRDDGSFGTERKMEKTVERHFGLGVKNEKWRLRCRRERGRREEGRRVNRIRSFVLLVCVPEKLPDRSAACWRTCGGLRFQVRAV